MILSIVPICFMSDLEVFAEMIGVSTELGGDVLIASDISSSKRNGEILVTGKS